MTYQFNMETLHLFTVDQMEELTLEDAEYPDETIDAFAYIMYDAQNAWELRNFARQQYKKLAIQRNANIGRSVWNINA